MKYMILSDIHGSLPALQKALDIYRSSGCQMLCLLGDILNYGPRNGLPQGLDPKGVASLLNAMASDIVAVRGNCDSEVDQMVLPFPILADYAVIPVGNTLVYCTHGHVYHNAHLPPLMPGDILLHGHTHVPCCEVFDTHIYMNPGSVSIPKENSHHGYMTLEDGVFLWKDFDGELHGTYRIHV